MLGAEKRSEYSPGTSVCVRGGRKAHQMVEEALAVLHSGHLADYASVLLRSHADLRMRCFPITHIHAHAGGESDRTLHEVRGGRHLQTMRGGRQYHGRRHLRAAAQRQLVLRSLQTASRLASRELQHLPTLLRETLRVQRHRRDHGGQEARLLEA